VLEWDNKGMETNLPALTLDCSGPSPTQPWTMPSRFSTAGPVRLRGAPIVLLGVPFDNVTTAETVALVERMVVSGRSHYLVTANVDFLVQAVRDVELRRILFEAHLVLCDGTPLLWASRWLGNRLSERVAGSDLVPLLIRIAAEKAYRIFFLGGSPIATVEAVKRLQVNYPDLIIAGHYSPPFKELLEMDHDEIKRRIESAKPDLLFVSFGCPKQEKWIAMHYRSLRVPVCIGVGGTIDFLAGRLARAPLWMQKTGTEWIFRLAQEPQRLFKRYATDGFYFGALLALQWFRMHLRSGQRLRPGGFDLQNQVAAHVELHCPEWLDAQAVSHDESLWAGAVADNTHLLLHLDKVRFIDSTGVGLLIRLRKRAALRDRLAVLVAPSSAVKRALESMRLWHFFLTAQDSVEALTLLENAAAAPATLKTSETSTAPTLAWRGEITAANAEQVWSTTEVYLENRGQPEATLTLDLSAVSFMDSTGVGLMVRSKKQALKARAHIRFKGLQPAVRSVVRLSKLETYLLED
jgi:N-acetylglucosaminyldiphosphoundecaprenol N-acetyl-beta-D-mannosaminyltransferase